MRPFKREPKANTVQPRGTVQCPSQPQVSKQARGKTKDPNQKSGRRGVKSQHYLRDLEHSSLLPVLSVTEDDATTGFHYRKDIWGNNVSIH